MEVFAENKPSHPHTFYPRAVTTLALPEISLGHDLHPVSYRYFQQTQEVRKERVLTEIMVVLVLLVHRNVILVPDIDGRVHRCDRKH